MTGGRRGGRRGGGPGRIANGGQPCPSPVEFSLYASPEFSMQGCPAVVKPAHSSHAPAIYRLSMPDRSVLGDIVLWFAAAAVAEPSARLVMWQASKPDKNWLCGYVEVNVPQLATTMVESNSNKHTQFMLRSELQSGGATPTATPPAPAAAAAAPAGQQQQQLAAEAGARSAADQVRDAAAATAQHTREAAAAAAARLQEVTHDAASAVQQAAEGASASLAVASQKAKQHAAAASDAAKSAAAAAGESAKSAAAATRQSLSEAGHQMNGAAEAAGDRARNLITELQAAYAGDKGPRAQQVAFGSTVAAAALAVAGVTLATLFGRRGRR